MAARQHYATANAGPVNNTSNSSWATLATLPDFEPDVSGTYAVFWSGAFQNASNATADAQIRVRFGPTGFESTIASLNIESAATSEYPQLAGMFFHVEDVAPVGVYADIAFRAETNGNSINAKNGQIVALKLGANDAIGESLARQTSTTTTNVSAATANFTSDGGDYVVVGYGECDCSVTTAPVYVRLNCNGTNTGELGVRVADTTNLSPGLMVYRFAAVPAGARSASLQFHAHSSTTAGITNARVLVMRAADFDAVYGGQLSSDNAGTQSTYTSAITVTETVTANPHLLLGGWGTSSTTSATDVQSQVTQGGAQIAESIRRAYNAAQIRFNMSGFASLRSGHSAGSLTWTLDRGQSGSNTIAIGAGSALVLFDLGASGGTTYNESLTETGTPAAAQSATARFPSSRSEAIAGAVSEAAGLAISATSSESLAGSAAQSVSLTHQSARSESLSAGDQFATSAVFGASAAEGAVASEATATAANWPAAHSESVAANDNAVSLATMPVSRAESLEAADDATASVEGGAVTYDEALSEAASGGSSAAATHAIVADISEPVSGGDASNAASMISAARSEDAGVASGQASGLLLGVSLSEPMAANDDVASLLSHGATLAESAASDVDYAVDGGERFADSVARAITDPRQPRTVASPVSSRTILTGESRSIVTAVRSRAIRSVVSGR